MQRKLDQFTELYELLRERPQQEAHEILERIRAGWNVIDLLVYIKEGDLLLPATTAYPGMPGADRLVRTTSGSTSGTP